MAKLTKAMRAVLKRGECILFLDARRPVDVPYRTWLALVSRKLIAYRRSNLDARRPWERYVITPAGRLALSQEKNDD